MTYLKILELHHYEVKYLNIELSKAIFGVESYLLDLVVAQGKD